MPFGSRLMAIKLTVNNQPQELDVDPDMPLLWAIRDHLKLTGTKFGCGMALCGACTVHIDGQATRSCVTPISAVAGKSITTIEGLSGEAGKARQTAWVSLDVPQCGYCQSGQIMSASALLAGNAKPTDADIDSAMAGNICRCATYARIRNAIHEAATALPGAPAATKGLTGPSKDFTMYFRHLKDPSSLWPGLSASELTRRQFLKLTTIAGAGLTLGTLLPEGASATAGAPLASPFVRIDPDNTVTVLSKHVEAGQGVWTGLPAIVADELDASWDQMRVESAPAKVPLYGNFAFDPKGSVQGTGASTAVANSWMQLRQAGATARAMLVQAAAAQWKVPAGDITVSEGVVTHAASGKKATFGELASRAAQVPVPTDVKLKDPSQFKIIGREKLPRLDSHAKSFGKQQFAIDVMLPGMMTAVVMRPPRFGGKVASFDATKTKAVPGVVDVVQIPRGVAVIGRDMWAGQKGREALQVTWDESAAETRGTDQIMTEYKQLAGRPEAVTAAKAGDADANL